MSVRKRLWTTPAGEERSGWVVDYRDANGKRRLKTFAKKRDADAFRATATVEVRHGTHVADSASTTVEAAGRLWLTSAETAGVEQTTLAMYEGHLRLHINPRIGSTKLTALTIPVVRSFEDKLRADGRSQAMIKKIMVSLGSLLADAQERGLVGRNVVREMRGRRGAGERRSDGRARLQVGVDIPTPLEIRALIGALEGRWRPLILTAIFSGMRASELRGLRWHDVDLLKAEIHVRRRADRFNEIGAPKSRSGTRTVPIPPSVVSALTAWKQICPRRATGRTSPDGSPVHELDLVFPNGSGRVEQLNNIVRRGLQPAFVKAGVTVDTGAVDDDGLPVLAAKYSGFHCLRHFYASWSINRRVDGGLELPAKVVQERLGHATVGMTLDRYGHLFPRGDDASELASAEAALMGHAT